MQQVEVTENVPSRGKFLFPVVQVVSGSAQIWRNVNIHAWSRSNALSGAGVGLQILDSLGANPRECHQELG